MIHPEGALTRCFAVISMLWAWTAQPSSADSGGEPPVAGATAPRGTALRAGPFSFPYAALRATVRRWRTTAKGPPRSAVPWASPPNRNRCPERAPIAGASPDDFQSAPPDHGLGARGVLSRSSAPRFAVPQLTCREGRCPPLRGLPQKMRRVVPLPTSLRHRPADACVQAGARKSLLPAVRECRKKAACPFRKLVGGVSPKGGLGTLPGHVRQVNSPRWQTKLQSVKNKEMSVDLGDLDRVFEESEQLAESLLELIDLPRMNDSARIQVSDAACSLSLEHWHAVRPLLQGGLLPSALVLHRAQFEALARSVWLTYAAPDGSIAKLSASLNIDSEQAARGMPGLQDMLADIAKKAPAPAYDALARIRDSSWKAMTSYAHSGVHAIRRHLDGYPIELIGSVLRNANGVAVVSCMQAVVLSGEQPLQWQILDLASKHPGCMPPLL